MKRLSTLLIAAVVPFAFAAPSLAGEGKVLGVVDTGNKEIVFKIDNSDIADLSETENVLVTNYLVSSCLVSPGLRPLILERSSSSSVSVGRQRHRT